MKKKFLVRDNVEYDFKKLVKFRQQNKNNKKMQQNKFLLLDHKVDKELYNKLYKFDAEKELQKYLQPLEKKSREIENRNFLIRARQKKQRLESLQKKRSLKEDQDQTSQSVNTLIRRLFRDKHKFKKSKIQNAKYEDRAVKEHMRGLAKGEDAIAFFAKYGNTTPIKFIHCVRDEAYPQNPYKLRIVHDAQELAKTGAYYTVSSSGIVHIHGSSKIEKKADFLGRKPTEFISLSDWMRESTQFNILSNIHFTQRQPVSIRVLSCRFYPPHNNTVEGISQAF